MNKVSKSFMLITCLLMLSGCVLPFQSEKYPAWTTKGILESYTLSDGRITDGWMGVNIGDKITTKWFDFTVNVIEEVNSYKDYTATENKKLIHATITVINTSDKDINISNEDYALVWNLNKDDRSYVYPKEEYSEDEIVISVKETKTIDLIFELDKDSEKPMAIYYNEQYHDGQKGNKYYIYYK